MYRSGERRCLNGGIILTERTILYLKFGDVWLHFSQVYCPSCSVTFLLQSAFEHAYQQANQHSILSHSLSLSLYCRQHGTYLVEAVVFPAEGDGGLAVEVIWLFSVAKIQLSHLVYGQEPSCLTCTQQVRKRGEERTTLDFSPTILLKKGTCQCIRQLNSTGPS